MSIKPSAHTAALLQVGTILDKLGPALEDAAHECLMAIAGIDTYDVPLCEHAGAWSVIEAFAEKVQAATRNDCAAQIGAQLASNEWDRMQAVRRVLAGGQLK